MAGSYPPLQISEPGLHWASFAGITLAWALVWKAAGVTLCQRARWLGQLKEKVDKPENLAKIPKNVAALLHAVFGTFTALIWLPSLLQEDAVDRYNCAATWHSWRQQMPPASFAGYIVQDLLTDVSLARRKLVPIPHDMLAHHMVFLGVMVMQLLFEKGCYIYYWLILTEGSTIPLLLRWFAIAVNAPKALVSRLNLLFAVTFFVLRVVVYGVGLFQFLRDDLHVARWEHASSIYQVTPMLVAAGYVLNLIWFQMIASKALRPAKTKKGVD